MLVVLGWSIYGA